MTGHSLYIFLESLNGTYVKVGPMFKWSKSNREMERNAKDGHTVADRDKLTEQERKGKANKERKKSKEWVRTNSDYPNRRRYKVLVSCSDNSDARSSDEGSIVPFNANPFSRYPEIGGWVDHSTCSVFFHTASKVPSTSARDWTSMVDKISSHRQLRYQPMAKILFSLRAANISALECVIGTVEADIGEPIVHKLGDMVIQGGRINAQVCPKDVTFVSGTGVDCLSITTRAEVANVQGRTLMLNVGFNNIAIKLSNHGDEGRDTLFEKTAFASMEMLDIHCKSDFTLTLNFGAAFRFAFLLWTPDSSSTIHSVLPNITSICKQVGSATVRQSVV